MIHIVHELRKARGTNAKKRILRKYSDNDQWKRLLLYTYNPYFNYYNSAPSERTFISDSDLDWDSMFAELDCFIYGQYTGNRGRDKARELSREYGEIFRIVLKGSLNAGISTTTINSVYKDLIPVFDIMLALDVPIHRFPVYCSTKYDGVRLLAFLQDGDCKLILRSGKELHFTRLRLLMKNLPDGIYDGELVIGDGLQKGRTGISGAVTKILRGTSTDIKGCTFCIFDYIPTDEWDLKKGSTPFSTRYEFLSNCLQIMHHVPEIRLAEQLVMNSRDEIDNFFKDRLAKGYEGVMVRYSDTVYLWDRTRYLIKKKAIHETVLTCIDMEPGTGKYEGLIGSLVCVGKVKGKEVKVKVGSGLSDVDREGDYIGESIEILYNDIVKAKDSDTYSLFLPRFKRVVGNKDI